MPEIICVGPDGSNLLGFLAAVGSLVALDHAWPDRDVRLAWRKAGPWRPALQVGGEPAQSEIVDALDRELKRRAIDVRREDGELAQNTNNLTPGGFRLQARQACRSASQAHRLDADFLSAIASDAIRDRRDEEKLEDSAFRTLSGVGHQDFFGTMRNLVETTTREDLEKALFKQWEYRGGKNISLRLDPREDRRYALRATDPGKQDVVTVPGANRLAIEALVCFPTFPVGGRLRTVGFQGEEAVWPIWDAMLSRSTIESLLLRKELYSSAEVEERKVLRAIGVTQVYRSSRINTGGGHFRNFTIARPCM